MPDVSVLEVRLGEIRVGTLTLAPGDQSLFAFDQAYLDNPDRPTLSLSFKDSFGQLITEIRPVHQVVPTFFSNLLPEGPLRRYLAERAGVKETREFYLLWILGRDLPGAVTVHPAEGQSLPRKIEDALNGEQRDKLLRFSLSGVQLKFSALKNQDRKGGLTIPAEGVGGSWIVKLPSQQFRGVPENEFAMMTLASRLGMEVPEIQLQPLEAIAGLPQGIGELTGQALIVRRFDRAPDHKVHIEDFAQIFSVFPADKYKGGNYRRIAEVIGLEAGEAGIAEFIRRLVFSTLIGNGDMHLKNWSLIYPDGRSPALSPLYDMLSTLPYIRDETMALNYSRTKKMTSFNKDELLYLAAKARLPQKLVLDTAEETVVRFRELWSKERTHLPLSNDVIGAVETLLPQIPIYSQF
ncbi:MAG TPA: type II toxin-antitoxin system HipA family toxin [Rhizomicrobium sp.]